MARRTFPKDAGERVTLQTRATTKVRDRLEEVARQSGRSLSQEMEMRLADSLNIEDIADRVIDFVENRSQPVVDILGGKINFGLFVDIAWLMNGACEDGAPWYSSAENRANTYKVLEAALPELLRIDREADATDGVLRRATRLSRYLPERPQEPTPEMPKGARFMTDEERKQFFYLNEDNAAPKKKKP